VSRVVLLSMAVVMAAACKKEAPVTPTRKPPGGVGVSVTDNAFTPAKVTVKSGQDVTWVWDGQGQHGIQFYGSPVPEVEPIGNGNIYLRVFDKPGLYLYYCPVHGAETGLGVTGMSGRVTVTE
jgi:plastocyanin